MTIKEICDKLGRAFSPNDAESDPDRGRCAICGTTVRASQQMAFTGEHLRCYVRQLQPRGHDSSERTNDMCDRRRHPRFPATWRLRLWFGELGFADARAENASESGFAIMLPSATTAASLLKPGKTVGLEVYDADQPVFRTTAAVRHRTGSAVGVECTDRLPLELLERLSPA